MSDERNNYLGFAALEVSYEALKIKFEQLQADYQYLVGKATSNWKIAELDGTLAQAVERIKLLEDTVADLKGEQQQLRERIRELEHWQNEKDELGVEMC